MPRPECSVEGCTSLTIGATGMCNKHRVRMYRNGHIGLTRNAPGEGGLTGNGYKAIKIDKKRIFEHREIAEKALGRPLPRGVVVHHVTECKTDNVGPFKLVICPDQSYHRLIHRLMREKCISFKTGWPNDPNEPITSPPPFVRKPRSSSYVKVKKAPKKHWMLDGTYR